MNRIEQLIACVKELLPLLEAEENKVWHAWFDQALKALESSDAYGCKKILDAYGGMGSFNDVILDNDADEKKRKKLASKIYSLAAELWKENS